MTARLWLLLSLTLVSLTVMSAPSATRILVHGHRGARALRPENTIPAFEYAIEQGADVLEMDVAVTRDNVLVISHDPEVNPVICRGPRPTAIIRELTLAEFLADPITTQTLSPRRSTKEASSVPVKPSATALSNARLRIA